MAKKQTLSLTEQLANAKAAQEQAINKSRRYQSNERKAKKKVETLERRIYFQMLYDRGEMLNRHLRNPVDWDNAQVSELLEYIFSLQEVQAKLNELAPADLNAEIQKDINEANAEMEESFEDNHEEQPKAKRKAHKKNDTEVTSA